MVTITIARTKNEKMFTIQGENPSIIHLLQGRTVIGTGPDKLTVKQMYLKQRQEDLSPPDDGPQTA